MAVAFEISKYLEGNDKAQKVLRYLNTRKAATIYEMAEAVREKPADLRRVLSDLRELGVIDLHEGAGQMNAAVGSMYVLTGYGHEVAATVDPRSQKR